jgi:hypothetical protein
MTVRRSLLALAALVAPSLATAQACLGGIAPPNPNSNLTFAGGTLDIVANANAFGGRIGMASNGNNREMSIYLGARSINGGGSSILAVDFGYGMDFTRSERRHVCAFVGVDMVNLSDADNGYADVPFGIAFGSTIKSASGSTTFVPFGVVAGNLNSASESELGEFSAWVEGGVGFRVGGGLTFTPSMRQSFRTGAEPVIRLLVMFPLSSKAMPTR